MTPAAKVARERAAAISQQVPRLREVRDALRKAGARNAAAYVARALKSVEGAERHAHLRAPRAWSG